jgi:4'-phosphopantetheinyl transferase
MLEKRTWVKIPDLGEIPTDLPCLVYCKTRGNIWQSKSKILSEKEMNKADSLLPGLRRDFIGSHILLRQVLAQFTKLQPEKLLIGNLMQGKPFLKNHPLKFNFSHSYDSILVAVSDKEIGIDIEEIQRDLDFNGIMDFAFSQTEKLFCLKQDLPGAFTQIWTLKEAYLKAIGIGLSEKLAEIELIGPTSVLSRDGLYCRTFICPGNEIGSVVGIQDLDGIIFYELL